MSYQHWKEPYRAKPNRFLRPNYGHPHIERASAAWYLLDYGSQSPVNAVKNVALNVGTGAAAPKWSKSGRYPGLTFNGTSEWTTPASNPALSNYITADNAIVGCWVRIDANGPSASNVYDLDGIICEDGGYFGLYVGNRAGAGQHIYCYNWDGNEDYIAIPFTLGQLHYIELMHTGSYLYGFKDGVLVGSTISNGTDSLAGSLEIGRNAYGSGNPHFSGAIAGIYLSDQPSSTASARDRYENFWAPFERSIWVPLPVEGGDTNVGANTDALTLTEYQASIAVDVDVAASTDALTLTAYQGSVGADTTVDANTDALTLTEYQASIAVDVNVAASTDALTLTTYQASLGADTDVEANTDALTLATYAASIANDVNVAGNVDALTLTEYQADVALGVNVQASTDALTLAEQTASIAVDVNVGASTDALTLTEYPAGITSGVPAVTEKLKGGRSRRRRRIVIGRRHYVVSSADEERRLVEAYIAELQAERKQTPAVQPILQRRIKVATKRLESLNAEHRRRQDEEILLLLAA